MPDYEFAAMDLTYDRWRQERLDIVSCLGLGPQRTYMERYFQTGDEYGPNLRLNTHYFARRSMKPPSRTAT